MKHMNDNNPAFLNLHRQPSVDYIGMAVNTIILLLCIILPVMAFRH